MLTTYSTRSEIFSDKEEMPRYFGTQNKELNERNWGHSIDFEDQNIYSYPQDKNKLKEEKKKGGKKKKSKKESVEKPKEGVPSRPSDAFVKALLDNMVNSNTEKRLIALAERQDWWNDPETRELIASKIKHHIDISDAMTDEDIDILGVDKEGKIIASESAGQLSSGFLDACEISLDDEEDYIDETGREDWWNDPDYRHDLLKLCDYPSVERAMTETDKKLLGLSGGVSMGSDWWKKGNVSGNWQSGYYRPSFTLFKCPLSKSFYGSNDPGTEADMKEIKDAGISVIINLIGEEIGMPKYPSQKGIKVVHFPITNMSVPELYKLDRLVKYIIKLEKQGRGVLAHCVGGHGRTGLVLAAYIIRKRKKEANEAIEILRKVRPHAVESTEQRQQLANYVKYLKGEKVPQKPENKWDAYKRTTGFGSNIHYYDSKTGEWKTRPATQDFSPPSSIFAKEQKPSLTNDRPGILNFFRQELGKDIQSFAELKKITGRDDWWKDEAMQKIWKKYKELYINKNKPDEKKEASYTEGTLEY